jgi:hypothetical protein
MGLTLAMFVYWRNLMHLPFGSFFENDRHPPETKQPPTAARRRIEKSRPRDSMASPKRNAASSKKPRKGNRLYFIGE